MPASLSSAAGAGHRRPSHAIELPASKLLTPNEETSPLIQTQPSLVWSLERLVLLFSPSSPSRAGLTSLPWPPWTLQTQGLLRPAEAQAPTPAPTSRTIYGESPTRLRRSSNSELVRDHGANESTDLGHCPLAFKKKSRL